MGFIGLFLRLLLLLDEQREKRCGSKKSSKLRFSFIEVLTVAMATDQSREHVLAGFCRGESFYTGSRKQISLVSCSCNFDNLSPSRLLLQHCKCLALHSGGIRFPPKERVFFFWRAAGTLVYHAAVTHILHVSCLTLQSINSVCCSPEAGLYPCRARNLVQQLVSYLPVKSCCLLSDWGYRGNEGIG